MLQGLNKKKQEQTVKVICNNVEKVIIVKDVIGDVVLFELGEIVPCDGIFFQVTM